MINDIKLGIKMMRYGHGLVSNIILGVFFLGIGIICMIMTMMGYACNLTGGCFAVAATLLPAQVMSSLNTSNMVLSSPVRKKMQTAVPTAINCICAFVIYFAVDLLLLIMAYIYPDNIPRACCILVLQIIFTVFFMIYTPICYKYMVMAVILGIMVYMCCFAIIFYFNAQMYFPTSDIYSFFDKGILIFLLISVLGIPIIAAAGYLEYLLSLLFYKAPVSKYSQNVFLKNEL